MPRGRSSLARPTRTVDSRLTGIASRRVTALSRHATYGGGDVPLTRDRAQADRPPKPLTAPMEPGVGRGMVCRQSRPLRFQIADYRDDGEPFLCRTKIQPQPVDMY